MELELRAKVSNPKSMRDKLAELGAGFIKKKEQFDRYFGSIELYKKLGYSFLARIRKTGGKYIFTVKTAKPKKDGVWEEYEVEIKNPETYANMFKAMGLEKIIFVNKKREIFNLDGIIVNIDCFDNYGTFIELEMISENHDKSRLFEVMKKLGIEKQNIIEIGYISIFLKDMKSPYAEYVKN